MKFSAKCNALLGLSTEVQTYFCMRFQQTIMIGINIPLKWMVCQLQKKQDSRAVIRTYCPIFWWASSLSLIPGWFIMTDFICHFFATINVFSVSDFHCHWTCFRTKRSATYIHVLQHLQIDLVEIIFIWCLKALSLKFWIYFTLNNEKKWNEKCLV